MFKGIVKFRARIKGNGLKFDLVEFDPKEVGVEKVEVESPNGDEILNTVYLASVATQEDGKAIATKVNTAALNRMSFCRSIAIENGQTTSAHFSPLNLQPGDHLYPTTGDCVITGEAVRVVVSIPAADLKMELEQPSSPREQYLFGLFRSALQSLSPAEEFMHLYYILMMSFNDFQADVDAFILGQDPTVPQTPDPRPGKNRMETVYTRLRNELAHTRAGVNLQDTKAEMANRLGELVALTKRAIELHP